MIEAIPRYALYGEGTAQNTGGFAHIETIAERSALHDWEIGIHRHDHFVQVLLVEEGHAAVTLDTVTTGLEGPARVIVPAAAVHGFRFRQGTRGFVLTLSTDFSTRATGPTDPLITALARGGSAPLGPEAANRAFWLAREMLGLQQQWQQHDPLFLAFAESLIRTVARDVPAVDDATRADRRLDRFRQLVELHYRQHRDLDFYAGALGLTRRTLSRLTSARLGCSPMDLIHRRLALEAHRLLRYTTATAAQVATELGFEDPSYFSRFYQRVTGRRPSEDKAG
ncbi:helix-turn-helix domain-containing protein [Novosphingobium taihuense]|uniref:AraC family transcriptional activator of pobA n=1 Tax=Novosphingobium taihuense TaxID=260085 RepID=A0A7W7A9V2_9SPHN|nr:helix-turn-helix domain-containing protein [Novosphingobium taihuense]MBB4612464.1 AraC family transcriptional activator of pobA [Novosphingobium taihuense]TWH88184.1 transcriptional regulator, AraC family [Novosphingobium taihuense]